MSDWLSFLGERGPELWLRTGEHIFLTSISTGSAIVVGIPLGILAAKTGWLRSAITAMVGVFQTVPSLAMLAFLLTLLNQIGAVPAIIALVLYALLPIVRNTLAGLDGVSPNVLEAADGIGMTAGQRLRMVELPIAMPVIMAGIRTAAVVGVGIATLSAFIGAGGLGQFINRGLSLNNHQLVLLGAIPSAILALLVDASISLVQKGIETRARKQTPLLKGLRYAGMTTPLWIVAIGLFAMFSTPGRTDRGTSGEAVTGTVHVGTKNFTEQLILGELMVQLLESETNLEVLRDFDLGGTMICHQALVTGALDLYAEYTGTALTAVLEEPVGGNAAETLANVSNRYSNRFDLVWLKPFGFNNTYAITVRTEFAEEHNLKTISDLRSLDETMRAGWTSEFSERPDGYPGLRDAYRLDFAEVRDLDSGIMYQAIDRGEVDVICAFATDGRIRSLDLTPLEDDLNFFPPYEAAPVVRREVLESHPEIRDVLNRLAGILSDETMQRLNYQVDEEKQSPGSVARTFLEEQGLITE